MSSNLDKYKDALKNLATQGDSLHNAIQFECYPEKFEEELVSKKLTKPQIEKFKKDLPSFRENHQHLFSIASSRIYTAQVFPLSLRPGMLPVSSFYNTCQMMLDLHDIDFFSGV